MKATRESLLRAHRQFIESADEVIDKRNKVANLLEAIMLGEDFPNPAQREMADLLRLEARHLTIYNAMVEQQVAAIREEEEDGR